MISANKIKTIKVVSKRCWFAQLYRVRLGCKKWYCFMTLLFNKYLPVTATVK
jgi:hypothetical protein